MRAHLSMLIKPILRRRGYPPGRQEKAAWIFLEQAEVLVAPVGCLTGRGQQ